MASAIATVKSAPRHHVEYDMEGCINLAAKIIEVRAEAFKRAYRLYIGECMRRTVDRQYDEEMMHYEIALREFSVIGNTEIGILEEEVEQSTRIKTFKEMIVGMVRAGKPINDYCIKRSIVERWLRSIK